MISLKRFKFSMFFGLLICFSLVIFDVQARAKVFRKIPAVFRQAMIGVVESLDPVSDLNLVEQRILENTQSALLRIDPKTGKLQAQGARKFDVAPDGLTIDFQIRDDLFFSNGVQVTAEDYAFALRRHLDPKSKSAYQNYVSYILGAYELMKGMFYHPDRIGIRAYVEKGKQHLRVELVKPFPKILYFFAHPASMPIHKKSFISAGAGYFQLGQMHASGAFVGVQKTPHFFIFGQNPHYHAHSKIQLKQVQLSLYDRIEQAESDFLKGKLDQVGSQAYPVGSQTLQKLQGSDVLAFQPDIKTIFLRFNTQNVKTKTLKLRQALAKAINRSELSEIALAQGQRTLFSIVPENQDVYDPPHAYYEALFDARKTLKDLGYCTAGAKPSDIPCIDLPVLNIIFPNNPHSRKISIAVKDQWKRLGFEKILTESQDSKAFVENINQGAFSIALDEVSVTRFDFFDLLHAFESNQSRSVGVKSPHFDQLMDEAKHVKSWPEAMQRYRDAESFLLSQASIIPLVQMTTPILKALHVKRYDLNLWDMHPWKDIYVY